LLQAVSRTHFACETHTLLNQEIQFSAKNTRKIFQVTELLASSQKL